MFRRIILASFMLSSLGLQAKECFTLNKKVYVVERLKNNGLSIEDKSDARLSRWFYCHKKQGIESCEGDDDAGSFQIIKGHIHLKPGAFLGEPDGPSIHLKSERSLILGDCS